MPICRCCLRCSFHVLYVNYFFLFYLPPYGVIMYLSSLFSLYWSISYSQGSSLESVPSSSLRSCSITNAINVSEKVVNGCILVLLSWTCGVSGFFEGVIGTILGLMTYRNYVRRRWILPFPSFLTSLLLVCVVGGAHE